MRITGNNNMNIITIYLDRNLEGKAALQTRGAESITHSAHQLVLSD